MDQREITRVRQKGTEVTNSSQAPDPGGARIKALRKIVESKTYAKIDGFMVDLWTASTIIVVHDNLNPPNQERLRSLPIHQMADISLRLAAKN